MGAYYESILPLAMPNLILYNDGQLLMVQDRRIKETWLSPSQMCNLLKRFQQAGFFTIETNGSNPINNPLYHLPAGWQHTFDGGYDVIHINGRPARRLAFYQPDEKNLVPAATKLLQIIKTYRPANLELYRPTRYLLWVQPGKASFLENPDEPAIPWPAELPTLDSLSYSYGMAGLYLEGKAAEKVNRLLPIPYQARAFDENGEIYTISARPLLPDELPTDVLDYHYELLEYSLPFNCPLPANTAPLITPGA